MEKFRRGDILDIKLVVANRVGIADGYIVFVNEEDPNAHMLWGFQGAEGKDKPVPPSLAFTLHLEKTIDEAQEPGV